MRDRIEILRELAQKAALLESSGVVAEALHTIAEELEHLRNLTRLTAGLIMNELKRTIREWKKSIPPTPKKPTENAKAKA